MANTALEVAQPSVAWQEMSDHWELVLDLLGGTRRMREVGTAWLPKEPDEEPTPYANRLARSFLHPGYKDGVRKIVARPFSRSIKLPVEAPERLAYIEADADGAGRTLTQIGKDTMTWGIHGGLSHIFVDMPSVDGAATAADERENLPHLIPIKAHDMLWAAPGGQGFPIGIRYRETSTEAAGEFSDKQVERIRIVLGRELTGDAFGSWQLWERELSETTKRSDGLQTLTDNWVPVDEPQPYRWPGPGVPVATHYTNRTSELMAEPALEELAWVNLMHWQSQSDQRNILRFLRLGILVLSGLTEQEVKGVKLGNINFWKLVKDNAKLQTANFNTAPAEVGRQDLIDLETRMEAMGLLPLVTRTGDVTATAAAIDTANMQSDIEAWVADLQVTMRRCYEMAATWLNLGDLPEDFIVQVYSDFPLAFKSSDDIEKAIKIRKQGDMTTDTFVRQLARRNYYGEGFDIDKEIEDLERDAAESLAALATFEEPDDDESIDADNDEE